MQITGAIFDMDGTLIDSLMIWDMLWEALGERYFGDKTFRPDEVTEKALRTLPMKEGAKLLHQKCGLGKSGEEIERFCDEFDRQFYINNVRMKDGVIEFLEYLLQKGVRMCIASAGKRDLLEVAVEKFGLDRYVSSIFSCAEIGRGKEYPDVYVMAHEFLGTPKESTWVFEDSVVALETAARAGYPTVGIYDPYNFQPERVAAISTEYIATGETMTRLIGDR